MENKTDSKLEIHSPSDFFKRTLKILEEFNCSKGISHSYEDYLSYQDRLKESESLEHIYILVQEMLDKKMYPNTPTLCRIILEFSRFLKSLAFENLVQFHRIAVVKKNLADSSTYLQLLRIILAWEIPDKIKLALMIMEEVKEQGWIDTACCNTFLSIVEQSEDPDHQVYMELFEFARNNGLANTTTYEFILDFLAEKNYKELGLKIYKEAIELNLITFPCLKSSEHIINLSKHSFGIVYFGLRDELSKVGHNSKCQYTLQYHSAFLKKTQSSKSRNENLSKVLSKLGEDYPEFSFHPDTDAPGIIYVTHGIEQNMLKKIKLISHGKLILTPERYFQTILDKIEMGIKNKAFESNNTRTPALVDIHHVNDISDYLDSLLDNNTFNVNVLNQVIKSLGALNETHLAIRVFKKMLKHNITSVQTYLIMMEVDAKNDVEYYLNKARKDKKCSYDTYNKTLQLMVNRDIPDLHKAMNLFNRMKNLGCIDEVSFTNMIHIIAKVKPFQEDLLLKIYYEAKAKLGKTPNLFNIVKNLLIKAGVLDERFSSIEIKPRSMKPTANENQKKIYPTSNFFTPKRNPNLIDIKSLSLCLDEEQNFNNNK